MMPVLVVSYRRLASLGNNQWPIGVTLNLGECAAVELGETYIWFTLIAAHPGGAAP